MLLWTYAYGQKKDPAENVTVEDAEIFIYFFTR